MKRHIFSKRDLEIAELLHQGKKYKEIVKKLGGSETTISNVSRMMKEGIIAFDEEGHAFLAEPARKTVDEIHAEVVGKITRKATETVLQETDEKYALGDEIYQYWRLKAQEKDLSVRDYARAALIFHDEYGDIIEEMKKERERNRETCRFIVSQWEKDVVRIKKMELFTKLVRYCLYMKQKGLKIPAGITEEFYRDLTILEDMGKTARPVKSALDVEEDFLGM